MCNLRHREVHEVSLGLFNRHYERPFVSECMSRQMYLVGHHAFATRHHQEPRNV